MSYINALYLAILQGLTEFLPVSSSGHLVLLQKIIGAKNVPVMFDLALHLGTTIAVIIFYRREIYWILLDLFLYLIHINNSKIKATLRERGNLRLLLYIIIATTITGFVGFILADRITSLFHKPKYASIFLLVTGIILLVTKFSRNKDKRIVNANYTVPVIVGLAQSFAMLPGISRSGSTISTALFLGVNREDAGRFSFLISIPSILGASAFEYLKMGSETGAIDKSLYLFAFTISFVVGLLALRLLVVFLKKGKLYIFGIYCLFVGILSIILI